MTYDKLNIFAKILRGEIPVQKLHEDDFCVAFPDISPAKATHILVIPKGEYISFDDFIANASDDFIAGFFKSVKEVAEILDLEKTGYRLISNHGKDANQSVPHFHFHILGGENVGPLVATDTKLR